MWAGALGGGDAGVGEALARRVQKLLDGGALRWVAPQQAQHGGLEDAQRPQQEAPGVAVLPRRRSAPQNHVDGLQHRARIV